MNNIIYIKLEVKFWLLKNENHVLKFIIVLLYVIQFYIV